MENVKKSLFTKIDAKLVEHLFKYYKELKNEFFLERYEQSQHSSAKFVEIVFRVLEYLTKGIYTPLGKCLKINDLVDYLENLPAEKHPESIRIHIPRLLKVLYGIRSKRGAIHVGEIDSSLMDAAFVVSACDWIVAEFIRLYHTEEPDEMQKIINAITEKEVPIIEEFDGDLKVLNPSLKVADQILLILYKKYPNYVSTSDLQRWVKTKSSSYVTTVLDQLNNDARIYRRENKNIITKRGIKYVETNLSMEI